MFEHIGILYYEKGSIFKGKIRVSKELSSEFEKNVCDPNSNFNYYKSYKRIISRLENRKVMRKVRNSRNNKPPKIKLKFGKSTFYGKDINFCQKNILRVIKPEKLETVSTNEYYNIIKDDKKELLRIPYHGKDILEAMYKYWTNISNEIAEKRIFSVGGFRGYHGAFEQENTDFEKNALFQINDEFIGLMELEIKCSK